MIATSVIMLVIVGCAFAFKTKAGIFCITTNLSSSDCTTWKQDFRITTSDLATPYRYYCDWDGTKTLCTPNGIGKCTCGFRLTID